MPLPINLHAVIEYRRTHEPDGSDTSRDEFILPHEYAKYHELLERIASFGWLITSASAKSVEEDTPVCGKPDSFTRQPCGLAPDHKGVCSGARQWMREHAPAKK